MEEKQFKEILNNLEQMEKGLTCIENELNTNNIMGRKATFAYLDLQIECIREYINGTAKIINKELES